MNSSDNKTNLNSKSIQEFTPKDTIYIRKMKAGFAFYYFCKFVKFEKGVVHATILRVLTNPQLYQNEVGTSITARASSCYLWGNNGSLSSVRHNHCYWFKKTDNSWKAE